MPEKPEAVFRRKVYASLFVVVVFFVVLYGLGVLRQNTNSDYIVLVLLGGFGSMLTTGILQSTGEINGAGFGISAKLTGAVAPLVVITGGGVYFKVIDPDKDVTLQVKFVQGANEKEVPVRVNGDYLRVEVGNYTPSIPGFDSDIVDLPHVKKSVVDMDATVTLHSSTFRQVEPAKHYKLDAETLIKVQVEPIVAAKPTVLSGTVKAEGEPLGGARIIVNSCSGETSSIGYFSFGCEGLKVPATLIVQAPKSSPFQLCPKEYKAETLDNNQIALARCDAGVAPTQTALPECGGGVQALRSAMDQAIAAQHPTQAGSITATLDSSGVLSNVTGGPPSLSGVKVLTVSPCKPVTATATVKATN